MSSNTYIVRNFTQIARVVWTLHSTVNEMEGGQIPTENVCSFFSLLIWFKKYTQDEKKKKKKHQHGIMLEHILWIKYSNCMHTIAAAISAHLLRYVSSSLVIFFSFCSVSVSFSLFSAPYSCRALCFHSDSHCSIVFESNYLNWLIWTVNVPMITIRKLFLKNRQKFVCLKGKSLRKY